MIKEELIKIVKRQYAYLKQDHDKWIPEWQDVIDLIHRKNIDLSSVFSESSETTKPRTLPTIFDTTALDAAKTLRYGMVGYTCAESLDWLKIRTAVLDKMELPMMREWLMKCEAHFYDIFSKSNFYESIDETVFDCENLGTTIIFPEETNDLDGIQFSVKDISEFVIDVSRMGKVDTVGRRFSKPLFKALEEFPDLPKELHEPNENPERKLTFTHMVFPSNSREYLKAELSQSMPFTSVYILEGKNEWCSVGGYRTFPMPAWIWEKRSGQRYGKCPGIDVLPAVKIINQLTKTTLRYAQKQVDPPTATMGRSRIPDLNPGAKFKIDTKDDLPLPVQTGGNGYPIVIDQYQRIENQIKQMYNSKLFLMLEEVNGQMTAREVIERQGEKIAVLSSIVTRFTKFLGDIIERVWDIEQTADRLPPMPAELVRAIKESGENIPELKTEFVGPLAQAQKKYHQTSGIQSTLGIISTISQAIKPDIGDNFNIDEMARQLAEADGLPADLTTDKRKVDQTRMVRQQAASQQQQANSQLNVAKIISDSAKTPEPGSPGEMLMQSIQQAQQAQMAGQQ